MGEHELQLNRGGGVILLRYLHYLAIGLFACHSLTLSQAGEALVPERLEAFLENHCYECHDDVVAKADLNLLELDWDLSDPSLFSQWVQVFDRVDQGEMPPKKQPRPADHEKKPWLASIESALTAADRRTIVDEGRVKVRRLTRREYQHTVHDLLGIDLPLIELLPTDTIGHLFDTEASLQQLSHFHLEQYLEAAGAALTEAFARVWDGDHRWEEQFDVSQLADSSRKGNYRGPEQRGDRAYFWPFKGPLFYGRTPATAVPRSGWYEITLNQVRAENSDIVWGTLQSGFLSSNAPTLFPIGIIEAVDTPKNITYRAYLGKRHRLRLKPADSSLKKPSLKANGGHLSYKGSNILEEGTKGFSLTSITMKRVYTQADSDQVTKYLLGELTTQEVANLSKASQKTYLGRRMRKFANRAFRRPVGDGQIEPYIDLVEGDFERTSNIRQSLFLGYRAILCSPRFLTFYEQPGKLDQHALASRLSYFLWSTSPDWALRQLADAGELKGQVLIDAVIDRLENKKSRRFINDFADQWLKLNDIDATAPDKRFRTYDPVVHQSIVIETQLFLARLVSENRSVRHFVQSDFSMLNERLVRFYKLPNTGIQNGKGFQKIDLGKNSRAGLITQASVLKVTADGTSTSPIVRGVYINERILGQKIPSPPPGIPAVEPDIRGASSIRDQIEKHRSSESCASCHRKIDPTGFALEKFNPVGSWRSRYGSRYQGVVIDPSGRTPDGSFFEGISGWKRIYKNQPTMLASAFVEHLLTYATGAKPSFSDRTTIEKIVRSSSKDDYGLKTLIINSVLSETFQTK